jgi:hypothetical protein
MANKRIKDISTASTAFASDDFVITDSATSGTRKMTKDNLISQVSAGVSGDYLEESNNLSDVASKDTSKLNLEVPDIGLQANQVPLSGMLNSGAWLDFDSFYETGAWTPTVSFGGGSTGIAYSTQEGYYTRMGDTVYINCFFVLTSKGTDTGTFRLLGLPFTPRSTAAGQQGLHVPYAANLAGLTSVPTAFVQTNASEVFLYDWDAAGATSSLKDYNFTDATQLRFSGTYQIA